MCAFFLQLCSLDVQTQCRNSIIGMLSSLSLYNNGIASACCLFSHTMKIAFAERFHSWVRWERPRSDFELLFVAGVWKSRISFSISAYICKCITARINIRIFTIPFWFIKAAPQLQRCNGTKQQRWFSWRRRTKAACIEFACLLNTTTTTRK